MLSPVVYAQIATVQISARNYDEAIAVCKNVLNETPTYSRAHMMLALAYWGKRMYPQVIDEQKANGQFSGDRNDGVFASALEQGFRSGGWNGALISGVQVGLAQRRTGYYSPYRIAQLYADRGDKDQAFRWLNTAYQENDNLVISLNTDFLLDPLRSDRRFAELVRKAGLPQ